MPSPDRRAAAALLALAAAFALLAIAATVNRSLIPRSVDGTVEHIEVRTEKHVGIDDVWLVHVGGDVMHVDAGTARHLREGDRLRKGAWRTTLTADGETLDLGLSDDARAMLWVIPLTLLCVAGAAFAGAPRRRRRPGAG